MQSIDTENDDSSSRDPAAQDVIICSVAELQPGARGIFQLPGGAELLLLNVDGEFYAVENSCPHRGAPLSEGIVCGHVVECGWHGWQFDMRTGECLTVTDRITTYKVFEEEGYLKLTIESTKDPSE